MDGIVRKRLIKSYLALWVIFSGLVRKRKNRFRNKKKDHFIIGDSSWFSLYCPLNKNFKYTIIKTPQQRYTLY